MNWPGAGARRTCTPAPGMQLRHFSSSAEGEAPVESKGGSGSAMEPPQVQASSSSNPNPGKEPEQLVREGAKAACLGGIKGCCSAFAKWACSILFGSNP